MSDIMPVRADAATLFLRMSLACPYSGCGGDSIVEITSGDEYPVYIAEERTVAASGVVDEQAEHEGFKCSDCDRPVSLPPGWTFQRS
ncbi:hypothetical protein ACFYUK_18615 [Nonomuraea wenchangensis]